MVKPSRAPSENPHVSVATRYFYRWKYCWDLRPNVFPAQYSAGGPDARSRPSLTGMFDMINRCSKNHRSICTVAFHVDHECAEITMHHVHTK